MSQTPDSLPKTPLLIIGNKNYASWSLRAWLLLRVFDVPFRELKLPLDTPEFEARIGNYAPNRRVPALHDGDVRIWDSLAICEYANERWLDGRGWPADLAARSRPSRRSASGVSRSPPRARRWRSERG